MSLYFPTIKDLNDWALLVGAGNWKDGFSAKLLAEAWHGQRAFPTKVEHVIRKCGLEAIAALRPLRAFPEYRNELPGGVTASQSDICVFCQSPIGLAVMMVEGKKEESFGGHVVSDWLGSQPSPGKLERLAYLQERLGQTGVDVSDIYYQLLHRTVAAIDETEAYGAKVALMLVHSFSELNSHFQAYADFLKLFELDARIDTVSGPVRMKISGIELYFAWVRD